MCLASMETLLNVKNEKSKTEGFVARVVAKQEKNMEGTNPLLPKVLSSEGRGKARRREPLVMPGPRSSRLSPSSSPSPVTAASEEFYQLGVWVGVRSMQAARFTIDWPFSHLLLLLLVLVSSFPFRCPAFPVPALWVVYSRVPRCLLTDCDECVAFKST